MGLCWSSPDPEPPVKHVATVIPTAPPVQQYMPPQQYQYNPNYTYAMKQEQPVYSNYPQPYQQAYPQQPYQAYPTQYQVYAPQQRPTTGGNAATAFVGGLVLGSIVDDIFDPTE